MIHSFSGTTANEVWEQALEKLVNNPKGLLQSRVGDMYELLHVGLAIGEPRQRWIYHRMPPMSIAFALAEIIWILAGSDDSTVINFWNPLLPKFAGYTDKYPGAYGYRIKHNFGFNQLEYAYNALMNNPNNRQTVILIWDPQKDFPTVQGEPKNKDIPCNICSLIKIRDNKLEWTQVMRSNDIFRGLPYNLIQFTSIQEILAGWLEIEVGSYNHYSDSLHLYEQDRNSIAVSEGTSFENTDSLAISKEIFDAVINKMYSGMVRIANNDVKELELFEIADMEIEEQAYKNIMIIIALYAAQKKGFIHLQVDLLNMCTNKLYKNMWTQWNKARGGQVNE